MTENVRNADLIDTLETVVSDWAKRVAAALESQLRKTPQGNGPLAEIGEFRKTNVVANPASLNEPVGHYGWTDGRISTSFISGRSILPSLVLIFLPRSTQMTLRSCGFPSGCLSVHLSVCLIASISTSHNPNAYQSHNLHSHQSFGANVTRR